MTVPLDTREDLAKTLYVIQLLLQACVDMDRADVNMATLLCMAAQNDRVEVVRLLLKAKAEESIICCVSEDHVEVVQLLLEASVDVDRASSFDIAPLYVAAEDGRLEII